MNAALEQAIRDLLERHSEVIGAYIFGSQARGDTTALSDIDLAVVFDRPRSLESLLALQDELERAVHMSVDLVDLTKVDAYLALEIVSGERIFERDGRRLDELDLYVLRRAGDLAPFERERRRMLLAAPPQ
jgi:predicted nucleotidyltransferase